MGFKREKLLEWQKRDYITSGAKAARIIGVSPSFYLDLLKGKKKPGIATLEKISDRTGIPITELLSENEGEDER
mgnify:CR=1 FL=1